MVDMKESLGVHDLGGRLNEPFNPDEHEYEPWEKRIHALRELLATKGLLRVDELRRTVESLGEQEYKSLSYYEAWTFAISQIMVEKGIVTDDELGRKIAEIKARHE